MKLKIQYQKRNIVWIAGAVVFACVLYGTAGCLLWTLIAFLLGFGLLQGVRLNIDAKFAWLFVIPMMLLGSAFTAYHIQYLLLDGELREKISDTRMLWNVLCCLVVFLAVRIFTVRTGTACGVAHSMLMLLAGVNYFVYLFRGNEFIFADLGTIRTGLSVAGNYNFAIDARAGYAVMVSVLYVLLMHRIVISVPSRRFVIAVCLSLILLNGVYLAGKTSYIMTETWEQKGSYKNGYLLNFVLSIRDNFVKEPKGYELERIQELEEIYAGNDDTVSDQTDTDKNDTMTDEKPTIIVVMNESYADLGVIGDFTTNMQVTPFYDSLSKNTLKGYALSSVFGAKTPNSEWEYLTGGSMAFLPGGAVVYQQYISDKPASVVTDLKKEGYTCVAMHPYYETGWSRNAVYPKLGFDEMYFLQEFDNTKVLRKYIADMEFYEKIIERFEQKASRERLFLFGISMQNHGGYTEKYENFEEQIRLSDLDFPDVDQYLSLLHESDRALEYLISYFEKVDDPVEIVFFGDHQPSLSSRFYPNLNGKGLSGLTGDELEKFYIVPFFIWTNYDTREEEIEMTSLNYLSVLTLERAGIELPAYRRFLADLMQEVPAINARGYYSRQQGGFIHTEDASGKEAEWISDYEMLQYNYMFDGKHRSEKLFPYLD